MGDSAPKAGFWSRRGVRARSTLTAVAVVAVALLTGGAVLVVILDTALTNSVRSNVSDRVRDVEAQIADNHVEEATATASASPGDTTVVQILDGSGTVLLSSPAIQGEPAIVATSPAKITAVELPLAFVDDERYMVAAARAPSLDGEVTVVAAQSLVPVRNVTRLVMLLLVLGSPFLLAAVGAVTWMAVGRSLHSVDRMRARVETIGARDLHERVPVPAAKDEIQSLALTMNHMLDRLEQSAVTQRRFVADASHELRSPLSSMRASLDVAHAVPEADAWTQTQSVLSAEVDRMSRLVSDLLLLARADEGALRMKREEVDLDDLASAEVARLRTQTSLQVTSQIEPVRAVGDRDRIAQALRNLVDNASRYAHAGVRISLRGAQSTATLSVEDDGPGIAADLQEAVLGRFVRLDEHRSRDHGGAGLGLAITAEIARLHGGRLSITESPTLGGALAALQIPLN